MTPKSPNYLCKFSPKFRKEKNVHFRIYKTLMNKSFYAQRNMRSAFALHISFIVPAITVIFFFEKARFGQPDV